MPGGAFLEPWLGSQALMETQRQAAAPTMGHLHQLSQSFRFSAVVGLWLVLNHCLLPRGADDSGACSIQLLLRAWPEGGGSDREPGAACTGGQVSEDLGSRLVLVPCYVRRVQLLQRSSAHSAQEGVVPMVRGNPARWPPPSPPACALCMVG